MTPGKKKRPKGWLMRAFRGTAWGMIAFNMAGPMVVAPLGNQHRQIESDLGVTPDMIRRSTKTIAFVQYPESASAALYALTQYSAPMYREYNETANPYAPYRFLGHVVPNATFGPGGIVQNLTNGSLPQLTICHAVVSSDRLRKEDVIRAFVDLPLGTIRHFPGTVEDYRKIFLLHELEHCNQNLRNLEDGEYRADREALKYYLRDGGDPDVVRAIIMARSINAMRAFIWSPENHYSRHYSMAPAMAHLYLNGPEFSQKQARAAYTEAVSALKSHLKTRNIPEYALLDAMHMDRETGILLADPKAKLSREARIVLEQNREAYRFFTTLQPPKPAKPAPQAPPLS